MLLSNIAIALSFILVADFSTKYDLNLPNFSVLILPFLSLTTLPSLSRMGLPVSIFCVFKISTAEPARDIIAPAMNAVVRVFMLNSLALWKISAYSVLPTALSTNAVQLSVNQCE